MEGSHRGFPAALDDADMEDSKGHATSTYLLGSGSEERVKSPGGEQVAWLEEYKDAACSAVRYPNTSAIPGVGLIAFSLPR